MNEKRAWLYDLLFILVLLLAGYLRLAGSGWGEGYHQHPDELFLSGVLGNLRAQSCENPLVPVDSCPEDQKHWMSIGEYFDTAKSTLNPYNRGYSFFVYGTFPLALIRFTAEAIGSTGFGELKFLARQMSALADLFNFICTLSDRFRFIRAACWFVRGGIFRADCDADPAVSFFHHRPVHEPVHVPRDPVCGGDS